MFNWSILQILGMHIVAFAQVYLGGSGKEISIMNIIVVCVCMREGERERESQREHSRERNALNGPLSWGVGGKRCRLVSLFCGASRNSSSSPEGQINFIF